MSTKEENISHFQTRRYDIDSTQPSSISMVSEYFRKLNLIPLRPTRSLLYYSLHSPLLLSRHAPTHRLQKNLLGRSLRLLTHQTQDFFQQRPHLRNLLFVGTVEYERFHLQTPAHDDTRRALRRGKSMQVDYQNDQHSPCFVSYRSFWTVAYGQTHLKGHSSAKDDLYNRYEEDSDFSAVAEVLKIEYERFDSKFSKLKACG